MERFGNKRDIGLRLEIDTVGLKPEISIELEMRIGRVGD